MVFVDLELIVKVLGWILLIGPVAAVISISTYLIMGAAKDDETIGGFVMLGLSLFLLGGAMLALVYFTDLFRAGV